METNPEISKLLRLKRYEQPPPEYFEDFLIEFQRRQRAELLRRPAWQSFWDRLMSIAPTFQVPQYAYAAIVVLGISVSAMIMGQHGSSPIVAAAAPANTMPALSLTAKPVTIGDTMPASARADGSLPPHYVLQSSPVTHGQPLSF